ncbi:hypothetical protein PAXRUDRAFT_168574, partial [Paxillus rubicundulus Ve08.2h10]
PVHSEKDLQYVVNWVICYLVLHNMIIQFEERLYRVKLPQRKKSETWARNEVPHVEAENEPVGADMNDGSKVDRSNPQQSSSTMGHMEG